MTRRAELAAFDGAAIERAANAATGNQVTLQIAELVDRVFLELVAPQLPGWFAALVVPETLSGKAKVRPTARKWRSRLI